MRIAIGVAASRPTNRNAIDSAVFLAMPDPPFGMGERAFLPAPAGPTETAPPVQQHSGAILVVNRLVDPRPLDLRFGEGDELDTLHHPTMLPVEEGTTATTHAGPTETTRCILLCHGHLLVAFPSIVKASAVLDRYSTAVGSGPPRPVTEKPNYDAA